MVIEVETRVFEKFILEWTAREVWVSYENGMAHLGQSRRREL